MYILSNLYTPLKTSVKNLKINLQQEPNFIVIKHVKFFCPLNPKSVKSRDYCMYTHVWLYWSWPALFQIMQRDTLSTTKVPNLQLSYLHFEVVVGLFFLWWGGPAADATDAPQP
jgi:hypothetical protein